MSELGDLLNRLRQTAGLPESRTVAVKSSPDRQDVIEISKSPPSDNTSNKANLLLKSVFDWAGDDTRRWDQILIKLKRSWHPIGWKPEAPRDLLVAWASSNFRLFTAQSALTKLEKIPRQTRGQRVSLRAVEADVSFYYRLASGLKPWAADALQKDEEGLRILKGICSVAEEDQS